jgi:alcohol dehydrogenase class IV
MSEQRVLAFDEVRSLDAQTAALWVTPSVRAKPHIARLVVIGGGTLIDEAKVWRSENAPGVELIAIASVWGSGAEASPIAVRNRGGKKDIRVSPALRPDVRAVWPELAATIPPALISAACGDTWSHALEGFLSPLASDALRAELARVISRMMVTPATDAAAWFDISAAACAGQAQSSVGLVHGIAHILEGVLRASQPDAGWGHAKLCSVFLWPVMRFNEQSSPKWRELLTAHGLAPDAMMESVRAFFDGEAYAQSVPALREHWMSILRDPCSRTNSTLVRPTSLEYFTGESFR